MPPLLTCDPPPEALYRCVYKRYRCGGYAPACGCDVGGALCRCLSKSLLRWPHTLVPGPTMCACTPHIPVYAAFLSASVLRPVYVHVITYPLYRVFVAASSALCCNAVDCGRYLCGWCATAVSRVSKYCSPRYLVYDTDLCRMYYIDLRVIEFPYVYFLLCRRREKCVSPRLIFPAVSGYGATGHGVNNAGGVKRFQQ